VIASGNANDALRQPPGCPKEDRVLCFAQVFVDELQAANGPMSCTGPRLHRLATRR